MNGSTLFDKKKSYVISVDGKLPHLDCNNLYNFNLGNGIVEDENNKIQLKLSNEFDFSNDGSLKLNSNVVNYITSSTTEFNGSTNNEFIYWSGGDLSVSINDFSTIISVFLIKTSDSEIKEYTTNYKKIDDNIILSMPDYFDYNSDNWSVKIIGVQK